jgi:hypothetical protein
VTFYWTKVQYIDKNMLDLEKLISGKASNAKGTRQLLVVANIQAVSDVLQQKLTSAASESA